MSSWMRNQIAHLYNAVLAPVVAAPYAPAEKFQGVRKTVSLLYNRIIDKIEYGRETLKNIVKRQGKKAKNRQQPKSTYCNRDWKGFKWSL